MKILVMIILLTISVVSFIIFINNRNPADIELKGSEEYTALVSLVTAIVALLGSVLTFISKMKETNRDQGGKR